MEDKKKFENAEEEPFELNDEELKDIAGGIEVPPPLAPPTLLGEDELKELEANIPMF